ncbi:MAG: aldose 1-epimerase, partial [Pseudomonadota bacterium]
MSTGETVALECGLLRLEVAPTEGGCILGFQRSGFDLMRMTRPPIGAAGDTACFPLVPFSGRIDHARFFWQGRDYQIPVSSHQSPHAIHGHGSTSAWTVDRLGRTSLHISYRYNAPDWPFPYRAWQFFELGEDALIATIGLQNEGDQVMPAGLGLHPYFDRTAGVELTA